MRNIFKILTIIIQFFCAFSAMFFIYIVYVFFDYQGGFENMVGIIFFQPILAISISIAVMLMCFLIGLPIRINKKINEFWRKNFYIAPVLVLCGIFISALSFFPFFINEISYEINEEVQIIRTPNPSLAIIGYFLVGIGFLHWYLPYKVEIWLTIGLNRIRNFVK